MKKTLFSLIDQHREEIYALGDCLYRHPELGYKEKETKRILLEFLEKHGFHLEKEYFETGFQVSIGQGKPHIGLIAELDAIPVEGHPFARKDDHAAHACGHSTQTTSMVNALMAIKESEILREGGKITLFFTPAEEYTDLVFREKLIEQGKIRYIGGKTNMLTAGIFDGVDCFIHLHSMPGDYDYGYGSSLAGFKYKKFTFRGKASHAGVLPHLGINALNEFTLFHTALGMLRETFEEGKMVRVHGLVTKGGDTINSVPSEVVYECYVRCLDYQTLLEIDQKIDDMAIHCAKALGGEVEIRNRNGYLPFVANEILSEVAHQNMLLFSPEERISANEKSIAGGDVGDISCFFPMIQFGYNGISGRIHGADFCIVDEEKAYIESAKITCGIICDLLNDRSLIEKIKKSHRKMEQDKFEDYLRNG